MAPTTKIQSVSDINLLAKQLLEDQLANLTVLGEISNFTCPRSGHWYFTLKDANAQIRVALFKFRQAKLKVQPKDGDQVILQGEVSIYAPRGDYQFIAHHLSHAGAGALQIAFEKLKQKLLAEGLFEPSKKKPIPKFPKKIAVITSASGAALQDILSVLQRRMPLTSVKVFPSLVQGNQAPASLIKALDEVNQDPDIDVVILGRGGGSLEDLWAFNHEGLARAVYQQSLPIISAVGHETDFTIIDFVADQRAATPSAAAELVSMHQNDLRMQLQSYNIRLFRQVFQRCSLQQQLLTQLIKRLKHPKAKLQEQIQRLDDLSIRLLNSQLSQIEEVRQRLNWLWHRFMRIHPEFQLQSAYINLKQLNTRLIRYIQFALTQYKKGFHAQAFALNAVSPLATLERGYLVARHHQSQQLITKVEQTQQNQLLDLHFCDGQMIAKVIDIQKKG